MVISGLRNPFGMIVLIFLFHGMKNSQPPFELTFKNEMSMLTHCYKVVGEAPGNDFSISWYSKLSTTFWNDLWKWNVNGIKAAIHSYKVVREGSAELDHLLKWLVVIKFLWHKRLNGIPNFWPSFENEMLML